MSWKQHALDLAEVIDALRIWPRGMVAVLFWFSLEVGMWFMGLETPTTQQASLVSMTVGALTGLFAAYAATGRKWDRNK